MQPISLTNSRVQQLNDMNDEQRQEFKNGQPNIPQQSARSKLQTPQYRPESGNDSAPPPSYSDIGDSELQRMDNEDISDLDDIDDEQLSDLPDDEDIQDLDLEDSQDQQLNDLKAKQKKEKELAKKKKKQQERIDPMAQYEKKQLEILHWCKEHPDELWSDSQFPPNTKQFYRDQLNAPSWALQLKNIQWKRPHQIHKDPKFIIDEQKGVKYIDCDAKQGVIAESWFIGVLTILAGRGDYINKLIVQKQFFDRGFVTFQFFKNGEWRQVIVDTILPYEKQSSSRTSIYSSCNSPQQFWIGLMQKAYAKLHGGYQKMCQGTILDGLVDLTGGISESLCLRGNEIKKFIDSGALWNMLLNNFSLKYYIGCVNFDQSKTVKTADQGQQGILQNHYYSLLDLRDFPKQNLKLVRIRNPWGSDGLWNGAFCQDSDDWDKHRSLKNELEGVAKTNKSEGAWWMSFPDWCQQYNYVYISKIFPENWQSYSIEGKWMGKTNGGLCPPSNDIEKQQSPQNQKGKTTNKPKVRIPNKGFCPPKIKLETQNIDFKKTLGKTKVLKTKQDNQQPQYLQLDTDDKWFNNPQYKIKVMKDTRVYISLMLQDQRLTGVNYIPYNFMIVATKSRTERIWERPYPQDIILQSNQNGMITNQRQVSVTLTLKRQTDKPYGIYMIIPNIIDPSILKKDERKTFFLRIFSSESIDVVQMPQTLETTVEDIWTEDLIKGRRRIEGKDNPDWCRNSQYFLNLSQPTQLKIILRKNNAKKAAQQWKIGMTICRLNTTSKKVQDQKVDKKSITNKTNSQFNNLQKLLQQTSEYLQAPVMDDIQRKLFVLPEQKFKQSDYHSPDVAALYYNLNPTEGPFIIIPSIQGDNKQPVSVGYKLTIFSNNPVELQKLDDSYNSVLIGKWQKDLSAGGCHLSQRQKQASQRTWSQNPKYLLLFNPPQTKHGIQQNLVEANIKITLAIAEKNWKKQNPNTVGRMIGLYLLNRKQGKLVYNQQLVVAQTNFLPVNINMLECTLGGDKQINKKGYVIMPSTYQSKIHGGFILAVKSNTPFTLTPIK